MAFLLPIGFLIPISRSGKGSVRPLLQKVCPTRVLPVVAGESVLFALLSRHDVELSIDMLHYATACSHNSCRRKSVTLALQTPTNLRFGKCSLDIAEKAGPSDSPGWI